MDSRVVPALRGSGARGVLPFADELPAPASSAGYQGGGGGRRSFASRGAATVALLCRPPPLARRTHLRGHSLRGHPPACPPRASMRARPLPAARRTRAGGRGAAGGDATARHGGADRAGARRILHVWVRRGSGGQGHRFVLGQCDRSVCMIAHLRMGGCRQSGQMWCWVHACGVLGAGGTPTTMRAVSNW